MQIKVGKYQLNIGKQEKKVLSGSEVGSAGNTIWSGKIYDDFNTDLRGSVVLDKYDKMRRSDGMVNAVLMALEMPIRSAEWFISGEDEKVKEFVKDAFFNKMSISFDDFLHHTLLMLPFGFSMFEKVWKMEGSNVYYKKLAPRLPKTLWKWHFDKNGGIDAITQYVIKNGSYEYIKIPIDKLLLFTFRREGSNYEGLSVLRSAYKHWYIKDYLYKIAGIGLERQAAGYPVAKLAEGYSAADKEEMENIVEKMRVNEGSGAVLPPGFELDVLEGKIKSKELLDHIQHHDTMIAKNILAGFMQLGQEGKGGSYSLSRDQSDFFMMVLSSVCRTIADTINRYAIPPLVDYNFNVKEYPKLEFQVGKMDKDKIVEGISKLVKGKVVAPDDDLEDWTRALLGLPEANEEARQAEKERKENQKIEIDYEKEEDSDEVKEFRLRLSEKKYWRELTKREESVKFKELDDRFTKGEKELIAALTGVADKQIESLLKQVEKAIKTGKLNELYKLTVNYRGAYADTLRSYMKDLAEFGKDVAAAEVNVKLDKISSKLQTWLKVKGDSVGELHAAKMKSRAMLETLNSVNMGANTKGILFNTKQALNRYIKTELNGTASITVAEAVNQGRNEIVKSGDVKAAQYSAILDARTCPLCRELDGMIVDVDNPDFDAYTPPVHSRCRCIWVYIHREEEKVEIDWARPSGELVKKHGQLIQ